MQRCCMCKFFLLKGENYHEKNYCCNSNDSLYGKRNFRT